MGTDQNASGYNLIDIKLIRAMKHDGKNVNRLQHAEMPVVRAITASLDKAGWNSA